MKTPAELRVAAAELRQQAPTVPTTLDRVARILASDVLVGPGANALEAELRNVRVALAATSDDLVRGAMLLDTRADALQDALTGRCGA